MSEGFSSPEETGSQDVIIIPSLRMDVSATKSRPKNMDFKHLAELADVAEKLQVRTEMLICM